LIAKPQDKEKVARMCADIAAYSLDEMKDRQKGIVVFQVVRDSWEDNVFHMWERYDSNANLGRHMTSEPYKEFMVKVNPYLEGPVAMALYEYKNGQLGPACTSEGPKGEGGLDDATGASGAAGGASMKQTSASFDLSKIEHDERVSGGDEEHDAAGILAGGLQAAKKQMDGLKGMFSSLFGGKGKGKAGEAKEKEKVGGRK